MWKVYENAIAALIMAAVIALFSVCVAASIAQLSWQRTKIFICLLIAALIFSAGYYCARIFFLIAALIYSAGYYSAPIFFLLRRIKKCFALPHFAAFSTFCVKSF